MGETGCGKTRLIRFLCRLQARKARQDNLNNMILMKVKQFDISSVGSNGMRYIFDSFQYIAYRFGNF